MKAHKSVYLKGWNARLAGEARRTCPYDRWATGGARFNIPTGARWLRRHFVKKGKGGYWHDPTEKLRQQAEAVEFVRRLAALPIKRKALENPVSMLSSLYRKPDQIIQPWQFGHGETKATCLWLDGLPALKPTNVVSGREQRIHMLPPSADRWKLRSVTYAGIAEAMAEQWGKL